MKSHHQLGSPGGAGQAGEPGVGGPETLSRDAKSPLAELVRSGSCQHARRGRVSTLRHNSAIPQAAPRRSPGSWDIQKGRGGGGLCTQEPYLRAGHPKEYRLQTPPGMGRGDGHGARNLQTCSLQTGQSGRQGPDGLH